MTKFSDFGLGGDFRFDTISYIDGTWFFVIKCAFDANYSGYITLITGPEGKQLREWMRGSMMFAEAAIIDPDFSIAPDATAQEAGFLLCKRLLEIGFDGCCNQQNQVIARRPDDLLIEQLSDVGVIRRYRP